jgi:hypothetical protein
MFKPISNFQHQLVRMGVATSTTVAKGDAMVDNGSGYLTTASAGGNVDVHYVAMESVVTTANGQPVLCCRTKGVMFEADTDADPAQTDVGTEADLAAAGTIDPDASTDDIFVIESIKGAATGRKVIGFFTEGVMNS